MDSKPSTSAADSAHQTRGRKHEVASGVSVELGEPSTSTTRKIRDKSKYRERAAVAMKRKRQDPEYRKQEAVAKKKKRGTSEYRQREVAAKKMKRTDPAYRQKEAAAMRRKRRDPEYRRREAEAKRRKARSPFKKKSVDTFFPPNVEHPRLATVLPDDRPAGTPDYDGVNWDALRGATDEQEAILRHVIRCLCSDHPFYIFVTGPAGCGKSRLITMLSAAVPDLLVTAPTGNAARNIGGQTLHSAFLLPFHHEQFDDENFRFLHKTYAERYRGTKCLLIDEVSMLGARKLLQLDYRSRVFRQRLDAPFGGLSVLALGDFRQLAPVGDYPPFEHVENFLGYQPWSIFKLFELTRVMRQREDVPFAEALTRLGDGRLTPADRAYFRARCDLGSWSREAVHLFPTNRQVHRFNHLRLAELSERRIAKARDEWLPRSTKVSRLLVHHQPTTAYACGMAASLELCVGARYILTLNVDARDQLVNGVLGRLRQVDVLRKEARTLWFEFEDEAVGRKRRGGHRWTPIARETINVLTGRKILRRRQFPVQAAEAITTHKSQGLTFSEVVVHPSPAVDRRWMYVACSRVASYEGLHIVGSFDFKKIGNEAARTLRQMPRVVLT